MMPPFDLVETALNTDRMVLEPLRRSHAAELFDVLADERLFRFVPGDPPASLESLARRFEQLERRGPPGGRELWLNWVMRLKSDGSCVGRIEATVLPDRTALLAYEVGAAHWGRGLATEACRQATHTLFSHFGVEQVVADVDTRNAASLRLLELLGFDRGAITRGADHFKGAVSDEVRCTLPRPASLTRLTGPGNGPKSPHEPWDIAAEFDRLGGILPITGLSDASVFTTERSEQKCSEQKCCLNLTGTRCVAGKRLLSHPPDMRLRTRDCKSPFERKIKELPPTSMPPQRGRSALRRA